MTRRRLGIITAVALLALFLALLLRTEGVSETVSTKPDLAADASQPAPGESAPEAEIASAVDAPPPTDAAGLHGLRLMSKGEAEEGEGMGPANPGGGPTKAAQATLKLWHDTLISVEYRGMGFAEALADLKARYGLEARVDPLATIEGKSVTFIVSDLEADLSIDLITKMSELAYAVDPLGTMWITTNERVKAIRALKSDEITPSMEVTIQAIRGVADYVPVSERVRDQRSSAEMAEWMTDRKVTVSIVNEPAEKAIGMLAESARLLIWDWSEAATKAAAAVPPMSLVGEDLPLAESMERMLKGAGLVLDCTGGGLARVETADERLDRLSENGEFARAVALRNKTQSDLRARRVRIEGKDLTLSAVAAQVSAQTAEIVVLPPGSETCRVTWESDGLEQGLGEVLDILSRDAEYCWAYTQLYDVDVRQAVGRMSIWLVTR